MILCNSVELIREKLTISEDGPQMEPQKDPKHDDDYVYDIYSMEMAPLEWIEDILSVQPYSQEWELVRGPRGGRHFLGCFDFLDLTLFWFCLLLNFKINFN